MAANDTWTALADFVTDEVVTASKLNQQLRDNLNVLQLGLSGDGSDETEGMHLHKGGALASRPAAGNLGRLYYASDIQVLSIDDGSAWIVPSIFDRDLTQTENVDNGGGYGHYSFEIPANELGITGGLRLTLAGDYLNNTGTTQTLKITVMFGGSTPLNTGAMVIPTSANRRQWRLELIGMNSATGSQKWMAFWSLSGPATVNFVVDDPGSTGDSRGTAGRVASGIDTTAAVSIVFLSQHGVANASLSLRKEIAILERLPAES